MADGGQVITELVIDAGPAKAGADTYSASMDTAAAATQRLTLANDNAQAAITRQTATMTQSYSTQAAQFSRMAAAADPVIKAQQQLERATSLSNAAIASGKMSQDQVNATLATYSQRVSAAEKGTGAFGASLGGIKTILAGLGIGFTIAELAKIPSLIGNIVHETAGLAHFSETIGVSTTQLQELRYAGSQVQVSTDVMDSALARFSKNLGLAAQGGGALFNILKANHVVISGDLMKDFLNFANLIEHASNAEQRNALITAAFGKNAEELGLMFAHGAAGIQTSVDAFLRLGVLISDQEIQRIVEIDKRWNDLSITIGTKLKLAALGAAEAFGFVWDQLNKVENRSTETLNTQVAMLKAENEQLKKSTIGQLLPGFSGIDANQALIDRDMAILKDRAAASLREQLKAANSPAAPTTILPDATADKQVKAFDAAVQSLEKETSALKAQAAATGLSVGEAATLEKQQSLLNVALEHTWFVSAATRASIEKLATAYGEAKQKLAEFKAVSDAVFQSQIQALAPIEQKIATALRAIYGDDYLKHQNDALANQLRLNDATSKVADWQRSTEASVRSLNDQAAALGMGAGAAAAFAAKQSLINKAIADGNPLSAAQIASLDKTAAALGRATDSLEKLKIANDIAFETSLLGLSDKEAAIANQLRSLYGNDIPRALNSSEAAGLRFVERLKEVHTLGVSIKDSLGSALAGAFSGATKTGAAFLDAMTSVIAQAASKFLATRITDALFGGDPAAAVSNSSKVAAAALDTSASHLVQVGPVLANAASALDTAASNLSAAGHGIASGATTGATTGGVWGAATGSSLAGILSSPSVATALTGTIAQAANAIASIESQGSGGYSARGPVTGSGDRAYGRYQVMGANIPSWTQQALGQSMSASQFLADPHAQDAVFQKIFGGLVTKYGNMSDAASAWFTGRPLAQGANASDVNGMTGSGYVARFNRAMAGASTSSGALSVNVASVGGTTISGNSGISSASSASAAANASGIGGFLKSPAGQAAIAGFSIGYQQQDPLGGALTGAASGYQSGGVKGGVVGAIGGLIGGFLGAAQAAHDAQQKAIQAWNGMAGQVVAFGQAMEGTGGGSLTQGISQVRDQTQKFADAAKAAGVNYQFLNKEFADFATRQIRNFVSSFDVMIEALNQGLGPNSPAVSAAQNILAVGDTLKAFVVDTQTAVAAMSGQQQPAGPTTKNSFFFGSTTSAASTAQPILPTAAQSSAVAAAQKAAQDYAVSLLQTPPALTAVQTSLLSLRGAAAQLGNVLQDLGMSATDAAQAVQTGVNQALDKIKSDFSSSLQDKINSVTGQSYVTDLNNLIKEAVGMLGDAQSLGLDQTPVAIYFQAAAQAIVDNAGVVGTSFDLLKARFPSLTGVVHAATASLDSFATSISDFLASIKVGSLSPLSPLAQLNSAQSTYDTTFQSARGGDSTAMGKITNVAQTFLQAAQSYFASSPNYAAVFSKITTDLATLPQLLGSSKTAAQLLGSVAATSGNANFVLTNNLPDVNKATDATAGATDATATSTDSAAQTLVILQGIQDVTKTASVDISNSVVALGKVTQGVATVQGSEYFGPMVNSLAAIQEYTRVTANNAQKSSRGGGLLGGLLSLISVFLFEKGGWVPGVNTGTDSVPALLTPGEFVLSKKHASVLAPLLNGIHSGGGDALAGMNASPSLGPTITPALSLTGSNDNGRHFETLGGVISANFNTQNRILAAHHQAFADMSEQLAGVRAEIAAMKQQQSIDAKRPTVPGRKAAA